MRAQSEKGRIHAAFVNEMLYEFEQRHGLQDEGAPRPLTAAEVRDHLLDEQRRHPQRERDKAATMQRGAAVTCIEPICLRAPPVRPDLAPARADRARAAQRKHQEAFTSWYHRYREGLDLVEREHQKLLADALHDHKERIASRRNGLRTVLHERQRRSKLSALERREPFWRRKEMEEMQRIQKLVYERRILSQVRSQCATETCVVVMSRMKFLCLFA